MSLDPTVMAASIATSLLTDKVRQHIKDLFKLDTLPSNEELVLLCLADLVTYMRKTAHASEAQAFPNDDDVQIGATIPGSVAGTSTLDIRNTQRAHTCLYTPVPVENVSIKSDMGTEAPRTLPQGWCTIDRPFGHVQLFLPTNAANTPVWVRYSDVEYGETL